MPAAANYLQVTENTFSEKNRGTVINWIIDMCTEFHKKWEVLSLSVTLFDRYIDHITSPNVPEDLLMQVQLVDDTSMFVAAKLQDTLWQAYLRIRTQL